MEIKIHISPFFVVQVPSDTQFQSITIGGGGGPETMNYKVWAVGRDGSVFLRHGISDVAPTGQLWLQVHAPSHLAPIRFVFPWSFPGRFS